ncbi:MAG: N-acetyl sugar amidotransferase [Deltaproteobacteria bacterium]|nr:N-acetyl sugar amidotransferase [Deltaproteobacteria bacterium]
MQTFDRQLSKLPKEVRFCRNCVVSNQRPRTEFNDQGICNACQWSYEKDHVVDWKKRERELQDICNRYRSSDGSFDVVVPCSGGKDSAFVAHQLKYRYGMHPLCVTWSPFEYTEIGWENLKNFTRSGFNNILGQPDQCIHRRLSKLCFELLGDPWQPFTFGQKFWAFHIAHKFKIPLIFYGENGEVEYGGSMKYKNLPKENPHDFVEHYFKGITVDNIVEVGLERGIFKKAEIKPHTFQLYKPPPLDEVVKSGIEMHWYSYYSKWVPQENFYYAVENTGFKTNPAGRSEGTYTKYASLDDKLDGFHWYMSYMKFGMGRASRDVQQDIRRHHITREEGVALVQRYDGEFPQIYYEWFKDYCQIDDGYFWGVCDFYRGMSNIWSKENGKWVLKAVVQNLDGDFFKSI